MRDTSLVEPFAVQEFFVDGFSDHIITNGVMSCAGYRLQHPPGGDDPLKVVVIRLVWPAGMTEDAISSARQAQATGLDVAQRLRIGRH